MMETLHVINFLFLNDVGAKPFKCPLCEMRFRTSGHRKAHLMSHMKHVTGDSKLPSQLTTSARRSKQVPLQQQEQESELQNPATSTTSELVTDTMTHITLDPATLSSLIPGEPFNSSLLTTTADGNHVVGNFQLQLTDGLQIAGVDASGTVHSYTTQAVQLDEALLHQIQVLWFQIIQNKDYCAFLFWPPAIRDYSPCLNLIYLPQVHMTFRET